MALWTDDAKLLVGNPNLWRMYDADNPPYAVVTVEQYEEMLRKTFAEGEGVDIRDFSSSDFEGLAHRWEKEACLRRGGADGLGPALDAERHASAFRVAALLAKEKERPND